MNVTVYSKSTALRMIAVGFPENVAVVSFYTPIGRANPARFRVEYGTACDRVFYVGVPDIDESGFEANGFTSESFLREADALADFIYVARDEGRDIICQCEFGIGRSAACAAAILEHFEGMGSEILASDRYHPNMTVYNRVLAALERRSKK